MKLLALLHQSFTVLRCLSICAEFWNVGKGGDIQHEDCDMNCSGLDHGGENGNKSQPGGGVLVGGQSGLPGSNLHHAGSAADRCV